MCVMPWRILWAWIVSTSMKYHHRASSSHDNKVDLCFGLMLRLSWRKFELLRAWIMCKASQQEDMTPWRRKVNPSMVIDASPSRALFLTTLSSYSTRILRPYPSENLSVELPRSPLAEGTFSFKGFTYVLFGRKIFPLILKWQWVSVAILSLLWMSFHSRVISVSVTIVEWCHHIHSTIWLASELRVKAVSVMCSWYHRH